MKDNVNERELKDYIKCIHNTKGRLRFRLTALGIKNLKNVSVEQRNEILRKIENITGITKVQANIIIASIKILYDHQITTEPAVIASLASIVKESFPDKSDGERQRID